MGSVTEGWTLLGRPCRISACKVECGARSTYTRSTSASLTVRAVYLLQVNHLKYSTLQNNAARPPGNKAWGEAWSAYGPFPAWSWNPRSWETDWLLGRCIHSNQIVSAAPVVQLKCISTLVFAVSSWGCSDTELQLPCCEGGRQPGSGHIFRPISD